MTIYSNNFKNITRGKTGSVLSVLSYIEGDKAKDLLRDKTYNHSSKDEVQYVRTMIPKSAPARYKDATVLWNEVEKIENRKNAIIAKRNIVALPRELSMDIQKKILDQYVRENFISRGYCATYAIHDKGDGNPHGHILVTDRALDKAGKWKQKEACAYSKDENGNRIPVIDPVTGEQKIGNRGRKIWKREHVFKNWINTKEALFDIRKSWAEVCNRYLSIDRQITEKSYKELAREEAIEQGITNEKEIHEYVRENARKATVHEGYKARSLEKKGLVSYICLENKETVNEEEYKKLEKERAELKKAIAKQREAERTELENEKAKERAREEFHARSRDLYQRSKEIIKDNWGKFTQGMYLKYPDMDPAHSIELTKEIVKNERRGNYCRQNDEKMIQLVEKAYTEDIDRFKQTIAEYDRDSHAKAMEYEYDRDDEWER